MLTVWLQLQAPWFTLCTRAFKESKVTTYEEYCKVAYKLVKEFLDMETVRA